MRDAFGVLGSGNFVATQALHAAGAAFHHARHEGGAISMADGYARVSGRVGVCSVHQGPGFTNALTGLTEAAKSRTPLLVLAGEAPRAAIRSNFAIDQPGLAATLGAVPERIHSGRPPPPTPRGRCGARGWSAGRSCSTCRSTSRPSRRPAAPRPGCCASPSARRRRPRRSPRWRR